MKMWWYMWYIFCNVAQFSQQGMATKHNMIVTAADSFSQIQELLLELKPIVKGGIYVNSSVWDDHIALER